MSTREAMSLASKKHFTGLDVFEQIENKQCYVKSCCIRMTFAGLLFWAGFKCICYEPLIQGMSLDSWRTRMSRWHSSDIVRSALSRSCGNSNGFNHVISMWNQEKPKHAWQLIVFNLSRDKKQQRCSVFFNNNRLCITVTGWISAKTRNSMLIQGKSF